MTDVALTAERKTELGRRVQQLAWATIGYNTLEALVAIGAGIAASSVALVSFGLDSTVEVLSAVVVSWQFISSGAHHEAREERARKMVAAAFLALALYVTYDSLRALYGRSHADPSSVGIGIAVASLIVMPLLTVAKRRAGRELGSAAVMADSVQTLLCTYLSSVLLVGLVLNAAFGLWWADPAAGLVIAAVAAREGLETWRGEDDCC